MTAKKTTSKAKKKGKRSKRVGKGDLLVLESDEVLGRPHLKKFAVVQTTPGSSRLVISVYPQWKEE